MSVKSIDEKDYEDQLSDELFDHLIQVDIQDVLDSLYQREKKDMKAAFARFQRLAEAAKVDFIEEAQHHQD